MPLRFEVESWIWYTFAVGIIVARVISRTLLFGSPKRLQYDDWIMGLFVLACYTVLIVMSNIEAKAQSNLLPPGFNIDSLTRSDIKAREYGSKIVIVMEQMQIAVIWACKACLLILYHRLTRMVASKENVAIKVLVAYVAFGFLVMEILYFAAWCRPFHQYWAVPTSSFQCNALINHRITNAVFNLSSDIIMLFIALPMFIRSLLPLKRKLVLCCIFSLGLFVILASVLNKYYSFTTPYEPTWIFWYTRESSTAILVANLPFTWTLLRKVFKLGAFDEEHPPPPTYHSSRTAGGRKTARAHHHSSSISGSADKHAVGRPERADSKTSHPKSFIGSICTTKQNPQEPTSETSQRSTNVLLGQAIRHHDFGIMHTNPDTIDLERGASLSPDSGSTPHSPTSITNHISPTSASTRKPRISVDSTGGKHTHGRLTSPHRAHLSTASAQGHTRSRNSSVERQRPMSLTNSIVSSEGASIAGGGRSARDRKIRARLSR